MLPEQEEQMPQGIWGDRAEGRSAKGQELWWKAAPFRGGHSDRSFKKPPPRNKSKVTIWGAERLRLTGNSQC